MIARHKFLVQSICLAWYSIDALSFTLGNGINSVKNTNFIFNNVKNTACSCPPRSPGISKSNFDSKELNMVESANEEVISGVSSPSMEENDVKKTDPPLLEEDWKIVEDLFTMINENEDKNHRSEIITSKIPLMHPRLLLKLKRAINEEEKESILQSLNHDGEKFTMLEKVGIELDHILDSRLQGGRDLLAELLKCGEIRKLDGAIGKAANAGKLDMAFFTVLNMNLRDAAFEAENVSAKEEKMEGDSDSVQENDANRLQILQHIYTRCQEEVEKAVSPGVGLLNKLLRTESSSIRSNQLRHYLGPPSNTITTPDGKTVELKTQGDPLVPPSDLVDAISSAVKQIRTVERAGGTDRTTAAGLVESCRQVAMEARFAIADVYGDDNPILREFELQLQPVFRPNTADSEYIKGQ